MARRLLLAATTTLLARVAGDYVQVDSFSTGTCTGAVFQSDAQVRSARGACSPPPACSLAPRGRALVTVMTPAHALP